MLLAIDIGNTNIKGALFKGAKIIRKFSVPVKTYSLNKLAKEFSAAKPISGSAICSVVPKLTKLLKRDLKQLTGNTPCILGESLFIPMKNAYHNSKQLGQDRLAGAYAACSIYPAPLVIIDAGTTITLDAVSGRKKYLGGLIFPGMETSLKALNEKTALLPKMKIGQPKSFIGRDTKTGILSGIVFGTALLSKEVAGRIKQHIGKNALVIGTGGNIHLIKKYSGLKIKIERDLTLKGINLAYKNRLASKKNPPVLTKKQVKKKVS